MSILRSKHSGWTHEGKRTPYFGGGGGGGQPTQSTSYSSNVPEYARPYVENMLGATEKQIFTSDPVTGEQTGFRPYQPYSTNPSDYVAGFSPIQEQAQAGVAGLQTPGQFGAATGLAGMAGLGSLGAGANYASQATNPNAVASYMSPYMQNVVDTQKTSALRDFGIGQGMRQAQATAKGAFGGSRQAIENSEAQRNLMTQLGNIQATGSQEAFKNAQQSQQFGSTLGLQGLGQAGQMAGTLGQLGTGQLGAQTNILNLQSQVGAQQQAQEQQKINQAIQDYATAQQYPMMQLGLMNSMLRGLPLQSTTTQSYQAQPSTGQQLLGYGLGALGAYKAFS